MYNLYNIKYENKRKCVSKDLRKDIYIYIYRYRDRQMERERAREYMYVHIVCMCVCLDYVYCNYSQEQLITNFIGERVHN